MTTNSGLKGQPHSYGSKLPNPSAIGYSASPPIAPKLHAVVHSRSERSERSKTRSQTMTASITVSGMLKFALSPATHRATTSP